MENGRLIAIGDIHGEYYKLESLLDKIHIKNSDTIVFLGDYIDRGLYSKQVVDKVIELSDYCNCITLSGNHEYYLRKMVENDEDAKYFFMTYGGVQTIESYGGDFNNIFKIHGDFYKNLKQYYLTDKYLFVHGGIEAGKTLYEQDEYTMLMIRNEFIYNPTGIKQKVIFGHTPFHRPLVTEDKIGIDTGSGKFENSCITAFICESEKFIFSD